jgi:TonB family protein
MHTLGYSAPPQHLFSPLPESKAPWTEFVFSFGIQSLAIALLLGVHLLQPAVLDTHENNYRAMQLVPTPAPVNHQPQPAQLLQEPVIVAHLDPAPEALRLPAVPPRPKTEDAPAPQVRIAAKKLDPLPPNLSPVIPKQAVRTNVFSTGSSAKPTIVRAPQQVQTGGFGDPNGIPAKANEGKAVNIAQLGSYDLPAGPGKGNGTGCANGARGVVASAGFGNSVATGDNSARVSASHDTVRQAGFGDADASTTPPAVHSRPAEASSKLVQAEILSKPVPVYTAEARQLRIEGEVLLEVVLEATGNIHVLRVVRGLGHGLDDEAVRAAGQIRFKPASRDGHPADATVVLHIIFQLA